MHKDTPHLNINRKASFSISLQYTELIIMFNSFRIFIFYFQIHFLHSTFYHFAVERLMALYGNLRAVYRAFSVRWRVKAVAVIVFYVYNVLMYIHVCCMQHSGCWWHRFKFIQLTCRAGFQTSCENWKLKMRWAYLQLKVLFSFVTWLRMKSLSWFMILLSMNKLSLYYFF